MTIDQLEEKRAKAIEQREHVARCAREEDDREVRADMYRHVDRINDGIDELNRQLYAEKSK